MLELATYRLQFSSQFSLKQATALVPYLSGLGISHVYASPLLTARPGSVHGYDVIDHSRLNPELGSEADLETLSSTLHAHGMGMILDLVPNHMCISDAGNARWQDVLENGPGAVSSNFFDIDWGPPKAELSGKVLLPILGDQFGRELERGSLRLQFADGGFRLSLGQARFPLTPRSWRQVLEPLWRLVSQRQGSEAEQAVEIESILRALEHWPERPADHRARRHEREAVSRRLTQLMEDPEIKKGLDEVVAVLNGTPQEPRTFDGLEKLMEAQPYRLAHWQVAAHEINYRRFFDVNDLAAIRVERDEVFRAVHELPLRWLERGLVDGFRIDHVDGLLEPAAYLRRLEAEAARRGLEAPYVVVEKILLAKERLPAEWAVAGTTGYEHLALTAGVLVDSDAAGRLRDVWRDVTGQTDSFAQVAYTCKRLILATSLSAELTVLARRLDALSEQHRYTRDFTFTNLMAALREVLACFPVYRTYVPRHATEVSPHDRQVISRAIQEAAWRNPVMNRSLFTFIEDVLLLRDPLELGAAEIADRREFALRVQQLTGPVLAKAVEDTAFYRYFPLLSLAEVGGDPEQLGIGVDAYHEANRARAQAQPRGLSASATHDTKRGEDLRARLHVLSELPQEWHQTVRQWRDINRPHRLDSTGAERIDPALEYFVYQSLAGAWPVGGPDPQANFGPRFTAYVRKAIAEAKVRTSWINPNTSYEAAVASFLEALLDPERSARFQDSLNRFVRRIAGPGMWNSLAQVLLKVAAPGVPDTYAGSELWDFSFTDPDNRRPVDFQAREALLADLIQRADRDAAQTARSLLADPDDGGLKLFVLHRALQVRRAQPTSFVSGSYAPCAVRGRHLRHAVAFTRGPREQRVLVVSGRLFTSLTEGSERPVGAVWQDTRVFLPDPLPGARYREALTDRWLRVESSGNGEPAAFSLADVFAALPVALIQETT